RKRAGDNAVALHQAESDLRQLLGLAPSAPLDLVGAPYEVDPDTAQLAAALADLPKRRPDLLALQAGYRAQEARLRGAILAQRHAAARGRSRHAGPAADGTGRACATPRCGARRRRAGMEERPARLAHL